MEKKTEEQETSGLMRQQLLQDCRVCRLRELTVGNSKHSAPDGMRNVSRYGSVPGVCVGDWHKNSARTTETDVLETEAEQNSCGDYLFTVELRAIG